MKNVFQIVIFSCTGITSDIYQYKIANIAFCYNSSLKKGKQSQNTATEPIWIPKLKHIQEAQNLK